MHREIDAKKPAQKHLARTIDENSNKVFRNSFFLGVFSQQMVMTVRRSTAFPTPENRASFDFTVILKWGNQENILLLVNVETPNFRGTTVFTCPAAAPAPAAPMSSICFAN